MRIWLDDIRKMPDSFDIWFKSGQDLVDYIKSGDPVTFISFDHDLSFKHYFGLNPFHKLTGYVICPCQIFSTMIKRFEWAIHSANPIGAKRIEWAMTKANRYWWDNEHK